MCMTQILRNHNKKFYRLKTKFDSFDTKMLRRCKFTEMFLSLTRVPYNLLINHLVSFNCNTAANTDFCNFLFQNNLFFPFFFQPGS